jgi:hypothetical protein
VTDLVERLRAGEPCEIHDRCRVMEARSGCCCAEAADEIERLRAAHKEAYELAYGVARHDCEAEIERLRADNEFLVESVEKHVAAGIRLGERANKAEAEIERQAARIKELEAHIAENADGLWMKRQVAYAMRAEAAETKLSAAVKALEPFAAKSGTLHSGYDDGIAAGDSPYVSVPVKHLRKAESTLKEIGGAS